MRMRQLCLPAGRTYSRMPVLRMPVTPCTPAPHAGRRRTPRLTPHAQLGILVLIAVAHPWRKAARRSTAARAAVHSRMPASLGAVSRGWRVWGRPLRPSTALWPRRGCGCGCQASAAASTVQQGLPHRERGLQ